MTKRKLMLVALSLCMVAILAIGGSLAFFTDTSNATNTFTVGDVDIKLDEALVKKDGDKWVVDEEAGRTEEGNGLTYTDVYPGAELPKDPTVHNEGTNDAYVRVQVQVNAAVLKYYGDLYEDAFEAFVNESFDEVNWTIAGVIPETDTVTFVINYNKRLPAGESTTAVFESIKVFAGWDNEEVKALGIGADSKGTKIVILAEAIQAEGFDTVTEAFEHYSEQEFPSNE